MKLKEYFERTKGFGVLATADADGRVDTAVYSNPHVIDEKTVAFIMADRLTHKNLDSNPYASYLFMEAGGDYVGKRLYLKKTKEETDKDVIDKFLRDKKYREMSKYLVYFQVEKVLPLVGDKE